MRPGDAPHESVPERSGESMTEQVGKIIDESQNQGVAEGSTNEDPAQGEEQVQDGPERVQEQRNPKKRMWEEDVEAAKQAEKESQKSHDEL